MGSILLACIGAGVSIFGAFQYFLSIRRGETRPRLASWVAWMTANALFTTIALFEHSWLAVAVNGASLSTNIAIIGTSMARGQGEKPQGMTDWFCLVAALACLLVLVIFTDNKLLGAYMGMTANAMATWPTIMHAWRRPKEEAWQLFAANIVAASMSLVGIALNSGFQLATVAGPLIMALGNVFLTLITVGRGWLTRTEETIEHEIEVLEHILDDKKVIADKVHDSSL